jgi:hypothetical protein
LLPSIASETRGYKFEDRHAAHVVESTQTACWHDEGANADGNHNDPTYKGNLK